MLVTSRWSGQVPAVPGHLIVAAPHPDDEVLGVAEIMRWAVSGGARLTIVAVTDGEGSHGQSRRVSPERLRRVRSIERDRALSVLGLSAQAEIVEFHVPDAGAHRHVDDIDRRLRACIGEGSVLCVPAGEDRHPDHRAVHAAGQLAAQARGVPIWPVPIWSRLDRSCPPTRAALSLDAIAARRKRRAAECFQSQLVPLGPDPEDGPVLSHEELDGLCSAEEAICG